MLKVLFGGTEYYDEEKNEFFTLEGYELELEHSLVSLSKWESKFEKPFLSEDEKSAEEILFYIECMITTENYPENVQTLIDEKLALQVKNYIEAKMSATWFNDKRPMRRNSEALTSELIYYWMAAYQIPVEAERWHLSRLINVIRIASLKNSPPEKMGRSEQLAQQRELVARRRAQYGSRG